MRSARQSIVLVLVGVGLGGGLAGTFASRTALAQHRERDREPDRNPRIHHALDALHDVQAELDGAPSDYHGHKRDAQAAVQHAMDELDRIKDW